MKKVLFIYPSESTFVSKDKEILSEKYDVDSFLICYRKSFEGFIVDFLIYTLRVLIKIIRSDFVYIWFADYHSVMPVLFGRLFKKRVFVVLGGYDIARLSVYGYGALGKKFRAWCVRMSVLKSYLNLPVSDYILRKAKFIFRSGNFHRVYNAFDDNIFDKEIQEGHGIVTVSKIMCERDIYIKGVDVFIKVAGLFPEHEFTIVGAVFDIENAIGDIPDNVLVLGAMEPSDLQLILKQKSVYCQFSKIESFGLAVLEAISCGCIPVVSRAGALPEVSGEFGYVINSAEEAVAMIRKAHNVDLQVRKENARRVIERFSVDKRRSAILSIIQELI